ncbi:MAG: O-acetyl-ADP-ribose deacetylase [Actinomycetota bacterium]
MSDTCAMARIVLVKADITTQDVDVIVNAANSSLLGGGGVDGAIHRRGGPQILAECRLLRAGAYRAGLPAGQAVATGAGNLPARHVIHVVGPVWSPDEDRSGLLASCHTEALRIAASLGAASIAFPAISTGAYGYPLAQAAGVAIAAVRGAAGAGGQTLEEIRFVLLGEEALGAYRSALQGWTDQIWSL